MPDYEWFALNDGSGVFGPAWTFGRGYIQQYAAAVGDLDRDGSVDLVTAHFGVDHVYLNVGRPSFALAAVLLHAASGSHGGASQVVIIDVNDDHKLDIVQAVPDENGDGSLIFRNRHGEQ